MITRRNFTLTGAAATLTACGRPGHMANFYAGPDITHIEVRKADRKMHLWSSGEVLKSYPVELGFAPNGPKRVEGDGKTPEGTYRIDRRNPESKFFLSLGISYPNPADVARARAVGRDPGGDIFIHGQTGARFGRLSGDWTEGCIALANAHMREVYWMVQVGTPITIRA